MKKRILSIVFLLVMSLSLTACEVHWGSSSYDVHWWVIAIPVVLVFMIVHCAIIHIKYECPNCRKTFRLKWYTAWLYAGVGITHKKVMKCPHCGKEDLCERVNK